MSTKLDVWEAEVYHSVKVVVESGSKDFRPVGVMATRRALELLNGDERQTAMLTIRVVEGVFKELEPRLSGKK